jgi:hypothetical protein
MAVSEGPGRAGFLICDWCGRGLAMGRGVIPRKHQHLWKDYECTGPLNLTSLAHEFQTDIVVVEGGVSSAAPPADAWSALYGLLEGASHALELSRDDIDGTLDISQGGVRLIIFDTVPGGAGNSLRIGEQLAQVAVKAIDRLSSCECGEETSCYACLRNYRNQGRHDELTRRGALQVLGRWT